MPQPSAQVTAADISRIAGVTRATVSNWRRRHEDFPAPAGGTDASPLYELDAVRSWLRQRGQISAATPGEELRTLLRMRGTGGIVTRLLPLVLAVSRRTGSQPAGLADLPDEDLIAQAGTAVAQLESPIRESGTDSFVPDDAPVVRALVRCVQEHGAEATLDVLGDRELEDSASSGTYRTPPELAALMARFLPAGTVSVMDPACGSGTLLAAGVERGARELYGQDVLPVQARHSAVRTLLSAPDAQVKAVSGDSLRADAFPHIAVHGVLCNPPFGNRDWGHEELAYDPRWAYGVPARAESELAWVQHALAHLEPAGHAVLLLPPATASRASGRRVRAELVRSGALRAIVGLPVGAAAPLHIGLQLWVLQRPEPDGVERTSVLFVDASTGEGEKAGLGRHSSPLRQARRHHTADWAALSDRVLAHWDTFTASAHSSVDEPGAARTVPLLDLLDDLVDLTPARQVRAAPKDIDPSDVARLARAGHGRLREQVDALTQAAEHDVWQPVEGPVREWRTATVSDLTRGGALEILRATPQPKSELRDEWLSMHGGRPVFTVPDIARGGRASGDVEDLPADTSPVIAEGDVLVRGLATDSGQMTYVADKQDAGAVAGRSVFLLRPDPARLDPYFLAGFLGAQDNITAASTGSSIVQVRPGRLRVPLLPLEEQRRYGEAFRRISELRMAARRAADLALGASEVVASGLTAGTLLPLQNNSS